MGANAAIFRTSIQGSSQHYIRTEAYDHNWLNGEKLQKLRVQFLLSVQAAYYSKRMHPLIKVYSPSNNEHVFLSFFYFFLLSHNPVLLNWSIYVFIAMETPVTDYQSLTHTRTADTVLSPSQSRSLWAPSPSLTLTVQTTTRSTSSSRRGRWRPGSGTRGFTPAWLESAR